MTDCYFDARNMKQARTPPPAPQLNPVNTIQKFVEINAYIATAPTVAVTRMIFFSFLAICPIVMLLHCTFCIKLNHYSCAIENKVSSIGHGTHCKEMEPASRSPVADCTSIQSAQFSGKVLGACGTA